jgi:hypothetical protein
LTGDKGDAILQTAASDALPLIGALVASSQALNDLNGQPGYFFIFSELSVRLEGTYRLKFTLMNLLWYDSSMLHRVYL